MEYEMISAKGRETKKSSIKKVRERKFRFRYGIFAGLTMGFFIALFQIFDAEITIAARFFKWLILVGFLGFGLKALKDVSEPVKFFIDSITFGFQNTIAAALAFIGVNFILFAINPEFAFQKFTMASETFRELLIVSGSLFFEVLVYGMIITFIWLQILKFDKPQEQHQQEQA